MTWIAAKNPRDDEGAVRKAFEAQRAPYPKE
jgi:hypothetical protein